jgi:hypothetical protein
MGRFSSFKFGDKGVLASFVPQDGNTELFRSHTSYSGCGDLT